MVNRKTAALLLASSLAFALSGCWGSDSADSVAETPSVEMQDSSANGSGEAAGSEKEPTPDENGLVPTDDPNVFKATRVLPKPESSVKAVKPEYPKLGFEHTYEGAEAVATYLESLVEYAYMSGDTTDLAAICSKEINYCKSVLDSIAENERDGNWHEGLNVKNLKLIEWGVPNDIKDGEYSFHFNGDLPSYKYFDVRNMELIVHPDRQMDLYVYVSFVDNRWIISLANNRVN